MLIILGQAKRLAPFRRLAIKNDCYQGCSMDWIEFLRRLGRSGPGNNNLCFSVLGFDYVYSKGNAKEFIFNFSGFLIVHISRVGSNFGLLLHQLGNIQ